MTTFRLLLTVLFTTAIVTFAQAQKASIALVKSDNQDYQGICYDIEVTLHEGEGRLSAQNYRLYYDASALRFDRRSAISQLTTTTYNPMRVVQSMHNSNASGFGNLEFSSNLGYINMTITDDVTYPSIDKIPAGAPIKTANFCFEVLVNATSGDIIWARDPITKGYASAFTELSIMNAQGTSKLDIIDYKDVLFNKNDTNGKIVNASND